MQLSALTKPASMIPEFSFKNCQNQFPGSFLFLNPRNHSQPLQLSVTLYKLWGLNFPFSKCIPISSGVTMSQSVLVGRARLSSEAIGANAATTELIELRQHNPISLIVSSSIRIPVEAIKYGDRNYGLLLLRLQCPFGVLKKFLTPKRSHFDILWRRLSQVLFI